MVCVIHTSATSQHTVCLLVCVSFTSVCSTETLCLARFLFLSLALSVLCLIPHQPIYIKIKVIVAKGSKYYRLHGLSQNVFTQNRPKGSDHSNYKQFKTYFLTYFNWYMFTQRVFVCPGFRYLSLKYLLLPQMNRAEFNLVGGLHSFAFQHFTSNIFFFFCVFFSRISVLVTLKNQENSLWTVYFKSRSK